MSTSVGHWEGMGDIREIIFWELLSVWDVILVSVSQIVVVEESMWVVVSLL